MTGGSEPVLSAATRNMVYKSLLVFRNIYDNDICEVFGYGQKVEH